jgi:stage V sporulation protein SpoVS
MPVSVARDVSNNKNRPLVMNGEKLVVKDDAVALALAGSLTVDGSAVTQPISAASLPLPSGAATDAYQINANSSLSSIDAALAGSLTVDGSAVTQPISAAALPLPSGAATESNQNTANTSLSSMDAALSSIDASLLGTITTSQGVSRSTAVLKSGVAVSAGDTTSSIDCQNHKQLAIYGSSSDNSQQLVIQASDDATNWYDTDAYVFANATSGDYYHKFDACARYYRVKYSSTATETTRYSMLA